MVKKEPRVGVFICYCGGNISDTVDVEKVRDVVSNFDGVVVAETNQYTCSSVGQDNIRKGITENALNGVVVASCSPRMHLETFKQTVKSAGLNPYLLEHTNIREQCSWIHDDKDKATAKAIDLIRGAVERVKNLEPLEPTSVPVNKDVLVIGGGISGIITSLELADKGFQVYLVEKRPSIGGKMAQLSKTFPTLDCSACIMTPKMVSVAQHPNIEVISLAEPVAVEGSPGNYKVTIKKSPRFVDEDKCIACGECTNVCPVKVPDEFEEGLLERKAIHIQFQQAIPNCYRIDPDHCLYLTKGVCGLCEKYCKGGAIDYDQKEEMLELNVGAITICTGSELIDPKDIPEYHYGSHPDIVTNLQFERLMLQGMHKPSNGEMPRRVAFILCVGSRMMHKKGVDYCCKIGCMAAIKQAMLLQKAVPDAEPWVFFTDIRADGKGYEEFYYTAQEHDVKFVRGRVAEVLPLNESELLVRAEATLLGTQIQGSFDMVVLTMGIIPSPGTKELAGKLGIYTGSDEFFLERHYKLMPVDSQKEGVYLAGCALSPKDVRESTIESMATASRTATFLGKGEYVISPEVAYIDPEKCNLSKICVEVCPVGAVEVSESEVKINPISCIGCGMCVPRCPQQAIELKHSTEAQLIAQIRAISEGETSPKILAFLEKDTAYGSADLAGQTRQSYSPYVRIIRVPSTARVGLTHLLHAFAAGADGIAFIEGDDSVFEAKALREYVTGLKRELRKYGVQPLRLISTTTTLPEYHRVVNTLETFYSRISKVGPLSKDVRLKIQENLS